MDRVKIIKHAGADLIIIDHSNVNTKEENLEIIRKAAQMLENHPSQLNAFVDLSDMYFSRELMQEIRSLQEIFNKKILLTSAIGVTGIKRILINAIRPIFKSVPKLCESKEEALNYIEEALLSEVH